MQRPGPEGPKDARSLRPDEALAYRPAAPDDAEACIELRGNTRENAFSADALRAIGITAASWGAGIAQGLSLGHVCTQGERLVGHCFGDTSTGEILVLAVLPEFEGLGIAKTLLCATMQGLRAQGHVRLFLGCSANPGHRSHGFYRRLGWMSTGRFDANGDEILEHVFG